ncbi:MAG: hypothetical protein NTZ35_13445 [Ignavibacteriales bacterium]|nr:hypothetical protein [Ignavibacteriales bacterium]
MKTIFIFSFAIVAAATGGCSDSGNSPGLMTGIQGQVYSIAAPGPTPVGWVPPPLERISTVLVLDSNHRQITEVITDDEGRFALELQPGTYYLRVKESLIPTETGPYVVTTGALLTVRAHYDNGMR